MTIHDRAKLFARYVGLELKGRITARSFTAKAVSEATKHSPAAFNRWLNGKVELPLTTLYEACEVIDVEPQLIVDAAYARVLVEYEGPIQANVGAAGQDERRPLAAKRGARKKDVDHAD